MNQMGEKGSSGESERSKGVRHVERVTARAGRVLSLIEAWIWIKESGKAEASEFGSGREMTGDETVVRRFSVTLISSVLWLHTKCQHYIRDQLKVLN